MNHWLSRIALLALFFTFTAGPIAAATNTNDVATLKTEGYKKTFCSNPSSSR
jgi:hypothetical protein